MARSSNSSTTTTTTRTNSRPYSKKNKYETKNIPFSATMLSKDSTPPEGASTVPQDWLGAMIQIIPNAAQAGKRKCGRFTVSLSVQGPHEGIIFWALVYVTDQVAAPNWLNPGEPTGIYKPSSAVLASGMNDTNAGPIRIWTPLFKNLNQGDRIFLLVSAPFMTNEDEDDNNIVAGDKICGLVRYAIAYN